MTNLPNEVQTYEDRPVAVSSTGGAITIPLTVIPIGTRTVFTVSVPGAPQLSNWTLNKGNPAQGPMQPVLTWSGPTPVGPFTIDGPDQLVLKGSNLSASTTYQAIALGKQGPAILIPPEVPLGPPQSVNLLPGATVTLNPTQIFGPFACRYSKLLATYTLSNNANTAINIPPARQNNPQVTGYTLEIIGTTNNTATSWIVFSQGGGGGVWLPVTTLLPQTQPNLTPPTAAPIFLPVTIPAGPDDTQAFLVTGTGATGTWTANLYSHYGDSHGTNNAQGTFTASGTLVAAPGAGLRLKLYHAYSDTGTAVAANGILIGTIGGSSNNLWPTSFAANGNGVRDFAGMEMDANTAVTVTFGAGSIRYALAYDIVPA